MLLDALFAGDRNVSCGIVMPFSLLLGGTIPHGLRLRSPLLLLATQTDCHLGRIETNAGNHLHHDRVSQTEEPGLSHQLFPPRQVLYLGGDPSVRCTWTLVLSRRLVFPGRNFVGHRAALRGTSPGGAHGPRCAGRIEWRSQTTLPPALSAQRGGLAGRGQE